MSIRFPTVAANADFLNEDSEGGRGESESMPDGSRGTRQGTPEAPRRSRSGGSRERRSGSVPGKDGKKDSREP